MQHAYSGRNVNSTGDVALPA